MGGVDVSASGPSSPAVSGLIACGFLLWTELLIARQAENLGTGIQFSGNGVDRDLDVFSTS
jgi:hypothetical protein